MSKLFTQHWTFSELGTIQIVHIAILPKNGIVIDKIKRKVYVENMYSFYFAYLNFENALEMSESHAKKQLNDSIDFNAAMIMNKVNSQILEALNKPIKKSNKILCACGVEHDLSSFKNIEIGPIYCAFCNNELESLKKN